MVNKKYLEEQHPTFCSEDRRPKFENRNEMRKSSSKPCGLTVSESAHFTLHKSCLICRMKE